MSIIIYSKPDCVQCSATYRAMDKQGLPYQVIDLTQDAQALGQVRAMGYQQVPVIVAGDQHWSGFRPDKISALRQLADQH
jgi:glutaredoxin-like protein NrdH